MVTKSGIASMDATLPASAQAVAPKWTCCLIVFDALHLLSGVERFFLTFLPESQDKSAKFSYLSVSISLQDQVTHTHTQCSTSCGNLPNECSILISIK